MYFSKIAEIFGTAQSAQRQQKYKIQNLGYTTLSSAWMKRERKKNVLIQSFYNMHDKTGQLLEIAPK